jgi:hypothetical protein
MRWYFILFKYRFIPGYPYASIGHRGKAYEFVEVLVLPPIWERDT